MYTRREILYIYLHVPKCAGSTFRQHIENNFGKEEYVAVYLGSQYFNLHTQKYDYFESRGDVVDYLKSLTESQKEKIKILFGHEIFYGIHEIFNKEEHRYVSLFRHPLDRLASHYNWRRALLRQGRDETNWKWSRYYRDYWTWSRKDLDDQGGIISFRDWVDTRPWIHNFVTSFLKERGFIDLKQFYFIGLAGSHDTDLLFLYHALGINNYYGDQNISKKNLVPTLQKTALDDILSRNALDVELYTQAALLNGEFKMRKIHFFYIVLYTRVKRALSFTFVSNELYRTSAQFRRKSRFYARAVDLIKGLV